MKKLCTSVILASTLILTVSNAGMVLDVEAGGGSWKAETTGTIKYNSNDELDLKDTLGLDETNNSFYYLDVNHAIPIVPNVRFESQSFSTDGSNTLTQAITFGNTTFNATDTVTTDLKLDQSDFILYWGLPGLSTLSLGHLGIDFGLAAKKFDGYAKIESTGGNENVNVDFTVPLGYLAAKIKIPFLNTTLSASTKMVKYKGSSISDNMIKASVKVIKNPVIDLKAEVGYKTQNLEITEELSDDLNTDIKIKGMFVGLTAKF